MRRLLGLAVVAALFAGSTTAFAAMPSATLDFEDGTDQGFGTGFGDDASANHPIVNVGGSLRMQLMPGGFQVAGRATSNPTEDLYQVLVAAAEDEANYYWSYDWYVDTSGGGYGTFLQISTYFNTGSGYYAQDWDAPNAKDVELDGDQLASGMVFSGTSVESFADKAYAIPSGETFFRPGFIVNGDGTAPPLVYIDNIRFFCIPEPATLALLGLAVPVLLMRRRRS